MKPVQINGTSDAEAASTIDKLIQELSIAKNFDELLDILLLFESESTEVISNIRAGVFLYHNYYLEPHRLGGTIRFTENMQYLQDNDYCPTAAPKLVGMPISKDGKACVLITKINDSIGGDLQTYYFSRTDEHKMIRVKFANELIALLDERSLYNPAVLDDSFSGWFSVPGKGNIVFNNWSSLLKCESEEEKASIKKKILKMCALSERDCE